MLLLLAVVLAAAGYVAYQHRPMIMDGPGMVCPPEYMDSALVEGDSVISEQPVNFDGLLDLPCYRFDAKLDGRIPVIIVFQKYDDRIVAGYIYYPKAKHPSPIMIAGSVSKHPEEEDFHLEEYQADGTVTGSIYIVREQKPDWSEELSCQWTNPKTRKGMALTDIRFSREMPEWFTETLLKPEDAGNIGRLYVFKVWNETYDTMTGGTISFRAAGKNRVHFNCANDRYENAEGQSEEGRPAVISGNTFEHAT